MNDRDLAHALAGNAQEYRRVAWDMLRRADDDETHRKRCLHVMLAMEWKDLADSAEWLLLRRRVTEESRTAAMMPLHRSYVFGPNTVRGIAHAARMLLSSLGSRHRAVWQSSRRTAPAHTHSPAQASVPPAQRTSQAKPSRPEVAHIAQLGPIF